MKRSREIRQLVLGWYHDLAVGDPTEVLSRSEHATFIGTGPGEYWIGGDVIRAVLDVQNESIGRMQVRAGPVHAFEDGNVGWASDTCIFELENGVSLTARISFVFVRENGEWRMVHGHASHETGNEAWGTDLDLSMEAIARHVERERPDLAEATSAEGTITIMFTDIENSTGTNEAMGDDRFLPLLFRHHEIVDEQTRARRGHVVKSQGDGFMLACPSARSGVECAIAVQRSVDELDGSIRVRMGLHTGEPVRHAEDFYGRDVAYAARLGAAARGGEVLVSDLVKSLVEPSGSFTFDGPREIELKGFDGSQVVYSVAWAS